MTTRARKTLSTLMASALCLWACRRDDGRSDEEGIGGTVEPETGDGDTTQSGETDGGPLLDLLDTDMPVGDLGCSADLSAVLDAFGQVVEECAPDEGCADGACVPACDAAAASGSNFGCHFVVPTPPTWDGSPPPCYAMFLTNGWGASAQMEVSRDGQVFDPSLFARIVTPGLDPADWPALPPDGLPPDSVAVLFLSGEPGAIQPTLMTPLFCPLPTAIDASTELRGSGRAAAFEVSSDIPLTAYDMAPFGGAFSYIPSAALLYPTSTWGTNYVAIAPPPGTHSPPGPLWLQIVGLEDGTIVEISPSAALLGGVALDPVAQGGSAQISVGAGEIIQWELAQDGSELSGTRILSDKPVALHTGNRFLRLQPEPAPGGDSAHQQNNPVTALGFEYVAAPYETRRADLEPELIEYRLVGTVDGTMLDYDPPIPGAPTSIALGEVVEFASTEAFRVRSQDAVHPFAMAQMMDTANLPGGTRPGATAPGFDMLLGDEEFVIVLPPAQFLRRYVFFTDPTYATTNLVITRVAGEDGFAEVSVDCLGTVGGWQPIGADGLYEFTTVDLIRADVGNGGCENGLHTAQSEGPFGLVVWGLDSYSSYAYPAGGNTVMLNDIVVPIG